MAFRVAFGVLCGYREILDTSKDTEFVRLLEALDGSGAITQNRWPDPDTAKEVDSRFGASRKTWPDPRYNNGVSTSTRY